MGNQELEKQTVTIGNVVKIILSVVFIIGWTLAIYRWGNQIDTKIEMLKQEQQITHARIDAQLTALQTQQEATNKTTTDLIRSVDKVTMAIENLSKQLDKMDRK